MTVRRVGRKTTPNSPAMKFVVVPIHWSCWIGKMMARRLHSRRIAEMG